MKGLDRDSPERRAKEGLGEGPAVVIRLSGPTPTVHLIGQLADGSGRYVKYEFESGGSDAPGRCVLYSGTRASVETPIEWQPVRWEDMSLWVLQEKDDLPSMRVGAWVPPRAVAREVNLPRPPPAPSPQPCMSQPSQPRTSQPRTSQPRITPSAPSAPPRTWPKVRTCGISPYVVPPHITIVPASMGRAPPPLLGKRVTIHALRYKPEITLTCGVAEAYDDASGRYNVRLEDGSGSINAKPANLWEAPPRPEASPRVTPRPEPRVPPRPEAPPRPSVEMGRAESAPDAESDDRGGRSTRIKRFLSIAPWKRCPH